jgi:hypothetical protein
MMARRSERRTASSRRLALVTVLLVALATVACDAGASGAEEDPEAALREAFEALADYDGVELLVQLSADEAARAQLSSDRELTDEDVERLLTASLRVRARGADGDGEDEGGTAELLLTVDDEEIAELRVLDELDLYLRLDLERIDDLMDEVSDGATVDDLVADAEGLGLGELAEALRRGDWVRITGLEQLLNLFGGPTGPAPEEDPEEQEALAEQLSEAAVRFLDEDVTVRYIDSDDVGDRVRATTDGATLRAFLDEVGRVAASRDTLGGVVPEDLTGRYDDLADDAEVSVDAWVSGGRLTRLALDLGELDESAEVDGEFLLVVDVAEFTGSVGAPDEATQIDLFELLGGFIGGFGGPAPGDVPDPEDESSTDGTGGGGLDDGSEGVADDGFEGGADDGFEDGFEDACLTQEDVDAMRSLLDPDQQAELDAAIEAGVFELC